MAKRYHYVAWYGDRIIAQIASDDPNLSYWNVRGKYNADTYTNAMDSAYMHGAMIKLYDTHDNAKPAVIIERQ
jgi:hypothetical protein